jgi:hypothetical protein
MATQHWGPKYAGNAAVDHDRELIVFSTDREAAPGQRRGLSDRAESHRPERRLLRGKHYLILDRDTKYSDAFRSVLVREGIQALPHHPVQRRQRLGGMLSYYHRTAA